MKFINLCFLLFFSLIFTLGFSANASDIEFAQMIKQGVASERTSASEINSQIQNTYVDKGNSIADNSTNDMNSNKEFTIKLRKKLSKKSKRRPSSNAPASKVKVPTSANSAAKTNALKYFKK